MRRRLGQRAAYESLKRKKNLIMNTSMLEEEWREEEMPGYCNPNKNLNPKGESTHKICITLTVNQRKVIFSQRICLPLHNCLPEPRHEKTNILHIHVHKQRHRSASR